MKLSHLFRINVSTKIGKHPFSHISISFQPLREWKQLFCIAKIFNPCTAYFQTSFEVVFQPATRNIRGSFEGGLHNLVVPVVPSVSGKGAKRAKKKRY
jgi:hypothetical protein